MINLIQNEIYVNKNKETIYYAPEAKLLTKSSGIVVAYSNAIP